MMEYACAIIGSGPGGQAAALAASRRGLRVCLIEREQVGGVCLNVGCIPTKALVSVARVMRQLREAPQFGIAVQGATLDFPAVVARTARIVSTLRQGLTQLLRREGVDLVMGTAAFEDPHRLLVTCEGGSEAIHAQRIVIASGAAPLAGPWTIDERRILSYRGLLALAQQPGSLLVIGGGVIGCEFASCFASLGTRVTIVEQQPQVLPMEDPEAVRWVVRGLEARGVRVLTQVTVQQLAASADRVTATLADGHRIDADYALVAIGIRPAIAPLRLNAAGVESGAGIRVNPALQTTQSHIAAIGDCLEGHGLAHWASAEGTRAVRNLLGDQPEPMALEQIPRCVFTDPELAHIGPLESQAAGAVRVSRLSFGALGKSHCEGETDGFVKLLLDARTDAVRGATIVGAQASSLIAIAGLAMRHGLTARQLAETITAHPTLPEAMTEAAAHAYGESLVASNRRSQRSGA